jgi:hypothetical protein
MKIYSTSCSRDHSIVPSAVEHRMIILHSECLAKKANRKCEARSLEGWRSELSHSVPQCSTGRHRRKGSDRIFKKEGGVQNAGIEGCERRSVAATAPTCAEPSQLSTASRKKSSLNPLSDLSTLGCKVNALCLTQGAMCRCRSVSCRLVAQREVAVSMCDTVKLKRSEGGRGRSRVLMCVLAHMAHAMGHGHGTCLRRVAEWESVL